MWYNSFMGEMDKSVGKGDGMARDDVDSRVNDVLNDLEELAGKEIACPICGETVWDVYPNEVGIRLLDLGSAEGTASQMDAVVLLCNRCRFVRLHGMSTSGVD
jgi:hypothetical protein